MQKIILNTIKKNTELFALGLLVIFVVLTTSYYNYSKKSTEQNINDLLDNVYLENKSTTLNKPERKIKENILYIFLHQQLESFAY